MSFRGSLKACINELPVTFKMYPDRMWTIICNTRAKYYTILSEEELTRLPNKPGGSQGRIVFRGTYREFVSFAQNDQLSLFAKEVADDPT